MASSHVGQSGIGTLTLGSGLTLESGSTALFEEQNNSIGDRLQVQGNLKLAGWDRPRRDLGSHP
jgi:hypothetical protein